MENRPFVFLFLSHFAGLAAKGSSRQSDDGLNFGIPFLCMPCSQQCDVLTSARVYQIKWQYPIIQISWRSALWVRCATQAIRSQQPALLWEREKRESMRKKSFWVAAGVCVMILPCQRGDACCQLPVRFGGCGPGKKSDQAWISPPFERRLCYTLRDASPNTQLKSTGARWTKKKEKVKMLQERLRCDANPKRAAKKNNNFIIATTLFIHTQL